MGNTIDYPVNHTLSSNTRHVVDALQIGMIASTLKNERTFNDLQFFVDRTAANYNQYYNRRCMLNARNEKTQRTRGIIVDLAATPRFRELPLRLRAHLALDWTTRLLLDGRRGQVLPNREVGQWDRHLPNVTVGHREQRLPNSVVGHTDRLCPKCELRSGGRAHCRCIVG